MTTTTIAQTILEQLGGNKFVTMTGATNLVASANSLTFTVPNTARRTNKVVVKLDADDTYTMEFWYITKNATKVILRHEEHGVYASMVRDAFGAYTGLYTHLNLNEYS
jgi:hypothetical protein